MTKIGRPTKFSEKSSNAITKHVAGGLSINDACALDGIGKTTFFEWLKKFPEFRNHIEKARQEFQRVHVNRIAEASKQPKHWTASAWLLERSFPQWQKKDKNQDVDVTINLQVTDFSDGGKVRPLEVDVVDDEKSLE